MVNRCASGPAGPARCLQLCWGHCMRALSIYAITGRAFCSLFILVCHPQAQLCWPSACLPRQILPEQAAVNLSELHWCRERGSWAPGFMLRLPWHITWQSNSSEVFQVFLCLFSWQVFKSPPKEELPFWSDIVLGFRPMSKAELQRFPQHRFGQAFTTLKCDCPPYLLWLEKR